MKKVLLIVLIVSLSLGSLGATPIRYEYTPYEEAEFPIWSRELRRAETIFFGSFVFSLPVAYGLSGLAESAGVANFATNRDKAVTSLMVGTGISLFISTLDWILGRFE